MFGGIKNMLHLGKMQSLIKIKTIGENITIGKNCDFAPNCDLSTKIGGYVPLGDNLLTRHVHSYNPTEAEYVWKISSL